MPIVVGLGERRDAPQAGRRPYHVSEEEGRRDSPVRTAGNALGVGGVCGSLVMSSIFISYRRADTSASAGRLYDRLSETFGPERVFIDIDAMDAGVDFVARTEDVIAQSAVVLALIGPHWLKRDGLRRRPRLAEPQDFVRLGLEWALRHGVRVIPVLVEGARFPSAGSLPTSLRALARRNAIELTDERWRYYCDRLISAIERTIPPAEQKDSRTHAVQGRQTEVEKARRREAERVGRHKAVECPPEGTDPRGQATAVDGFPAPEPSPSPRPARAGRPAPQLVAGGPGWSASSPCLEVSSLRSR